MNRTDVDNFEKITVQLNGVYQELSLLAKKSPNDAVNPFKLNLINSVLRRCNELLGEKYRPFPDFDEFSADNVPSNSDVTFILSQYIECTEKFRSDSIHMDGGWWYWTTDNSDEEIRTSAPRKLGK